jgi:hypothetical protein
MLTISLQILLVYALTVSLALIWLNVRKTGPLAAAGWTITVCVAIAIAQFAASGTSTPSRQDLQFWLLFVMTPAVAVYGVSRRKVLRRRPWWLLLAGPISFVVTVVAVMVLYNIFFSSRPR